MNAFELFGTISINGDKANSALDEISGKGKALASALGKGFAVAGKAVVAGVAAASAAIGTLTVASVKSYAEYEQLVGGVETLFKDSSKAVMYFANTAYKSAGLSANEYMSTVTSFSASLLQGLGGDTAAAALIAHKAILDMSDNANKMGTSMELIQNAYQGFAKQNYTMLDNLKLGYGGTQAEMARLINDSGVLGEAFIATAENLKEIPFDKQIEAIHAIQEEMGITGTTAKEASETISGSWAAMGAAWTNLVTGIADDSQNLDMLVSNFAESAVTAFTNISKRIPSIVKGINQLIRGIAPKLPGMIRDLLPQVVDGAIGLISGLAMALPDIMQILVDMLPSIMEQLASAFEGVFPILMDTVTDLFVQLFDFVSVGLLNTGINFANVASAAKSAFDKIASYFNGVFTEGGINFQLLGAAIGNLFTDLSSYIANTFVDLAQKVPAMLNDVGQAISTAWTTAVWPMIQGLFQAVFGVELPDWGMLGQSILDGWNTVVWPSIQSFFQARFNVELPNWEETQTAISEWWTNSSTPTLQNIKAFANDVVKALSAVANWVAGDGATLILTLGAIAVGFGLVSGAISVMFSPITALIALTLVLIANWEQVKAVVDLAFNAIVGWLETNLGAPLETFRANVIQPLIERWNEVKAGILAAATQVGDFLGIDLVAGWDKITNAISSAWNAVASAISSATSALQSFLGLSGNQGLGGGDARPWYVKSNPAKYPLQSNAKGAIFSRSTIFGTRLGLQEVGEAGPEAVAPISVLQGYVSDAVARQNAGIVNALERVVDAIDNMNEGMGNNLRAALDGVSVGVNKREFGRLVKAVT